MYVCSIYRSLFSLPSPSPNRRTRTGFTNVVKTPHEVIPKLFGPIRERYVDRPGGYTRVLRVEPKKDDQAPSAILELVDGPKDMRFALTAKTLALRREKGYEAMNEITAMNVKKVTQFRKDGVEDLEKAIEKVKLDKENGEDEGKAKKVSKSRKSSS